MNFKIKCIKDFRGYAYKGNVYEFISGITRWGDGMLSCKYRDFKDFIKGNPGFENHFIEIKEDNIMKELKKYLLTEILREVEKAIEEDKLIVITGERQGTGKTTVCSLLKEEGINACESEDGILDLKSIEERDVFILDFDKFSLERTVKIEFDFKVAQLKRILELMDLIGRGDIKILLKRAYPDINIPEKKYNAALYALYVELATIYEKISN